MTFKQRHIWPEMEATVLDFARLFSLMTYLRRGIIACAFGAVFSALAAQAMVPWLTRSADNARSGWNPHETSLSQASVTNKGIKRFTIIPVFGDAGASKLSP